MGSTPHETQKLLTVQEVAQLLRLSVWTVYRRIESGELPAVRVGTGPNAPLRVDLDELNEYVYGPGDTAA